MQYREWQYSFNIDTYKLVASEDSDIEVWVLSDPDDATSWYQLDDTDLEYWVGHLIFWYEDKYGSNDGPTRAWTEEDYQRAAQMCMSAKHIIPAPKLEDICAISNMWNIPCRDYVEAKRYLDLYLNGKQEFREGAD